MARTIRDIPVYNRSVPEVMNEIMAWASANNGKIEDNRGTYVKVSLRKLGVEYAASFVMSVQKTIEITLQQSPNGIIVHTEGYVKPPMGKEEEFSPNAVMTGPAKRQGWHAIEDLWRRLGSLSGGYMQQMPFQQQPQYTPPAPAAPPSQWTQSGAVAYPQQQYPQQQPGYQQPAPQPQPVPIAPQEEKTKPSARFCSQCGSPVSGAGKFCRSCGSPIE